MFKKGQKAWNKGINHLSPEARKRISLAMKKRLKERGHPRGMLGKHHTITTKSKQSKWRPNAEQLSRMVHKEENHPRWLGERKEVACPQCGKSNYFRPTWPQKFCNRECAGKFKRGKPLEHITRETLPRTKCKVCKKPNIGLHVTVHKGCKGQYYFGKRMGSWKGGLTTLNKSIRGLSKMLKWRGIIYKRDDYTCQLCGEKGGELNADHYPISLAELITKYNINNTEEANRCVELWDITNGRTLCLTCHKKTDNYLKNIKYI